MLSYLIFAVTLVINISAQAERSSMNFFRQTPADADNLIAIWLAFFIEPKHCCSNKEYLRKQFELHPSYFVFRDDEALATYFTDYLPRFIEWKLFRSVEIGDPQFPDLWKQIDRVTSVLETPLGAGYLWTPMEKCNCSML